MTSLPRSSFASRSALVLGSSALVALLHAGCSSPAGMVGPGTDAGARGDGATDGAIGGDASPDAGTPADAGRDAGSSTPDTGPTSCPPPPTCDATPPDPGATQDWRHSVATTVTVSQGSAQHRGRDLFLRESDAQWALAKFAYGLADDDLKGEDVDLWLLRDCTTWELLGTATTTYDGDHDTVEGVEDTGGRVYFEIPADRRLGLGRHRIHYVVRGDHTVAEQYIEVVPDDTRFVVTDVDGTLTTSESVAFTALLTGTPPDANPHAAELLQAYADRGYRIWYLTARPEWLGTTTQDWLALRGFPAGVVHTTLTFTGGLGSAAQTFKTDELAAHEARFPGSIDYLIGNTDTDMASFQTTGAPSGHVYSYMFDPGAYGTRVDDYGALVSGAAALPLVCF
ncbi:MAG: phosphatidylinositol transfer protein [Sandaracinus sp.]